MDAPFEWEAENLNHKEISFTMNLKDKVTVSVSNSLSEKVSLVFNPKENKILFDRTGSGIVDFEESFGKEIQSQPYMPIEKEVEVKIIIDQSSVEVFIDKGKNVFTNQIFPKQVYTKLDISGSEGAVISNLVINNIKSIWNEN